MKLNPDCMRDVLIVMEKAGYQEYLRPSAIYEALPTYSEDEINYTIIKLNEAKFIDAIIKEYNTGVTILSLNDITYTGHQFLADVRSDSIWNEIKKISKKVGSDSISAISEIAASVVSSFVKNQFGL